MKPVSRFGRGLSSSLFLIPMLGLLLGACQADQSDKGKQDPEVQALVERSLKDLTFVRGGSFWMGDYIHPALSKSGYEAWWTADRSARFQHEVELDGFHIGRHEVTYADFDVYSRATGQPLIWQHSGKRPIRRPNKPANATWHQARAYCQWLGKQTGLPFDLPTEAQWEYAARNRGRWVGFATDTGLMDLDRNLPRFEDYAHEVGRYPPNPLGIYDMSANAGEWVLDWYDPWYYWYSPRKNPKGPKTGKKKVYRGGSFFAGHSDQTVYARSAWFPNQELYTVGFRCVVNVDTPLPQALVVDEATIDRALAGNERPPVYPLGSKNFAYLPKGPVPEQVKPLLEKHRKQ